MSPGNVPGAPRRHALIVTLVTLGVLACVYAAIFLATLHKHPVMRELPAWIATVAGVALFFGAWLASERPTRRGRAARAR